MLYLILYSLIETCPLLHLPNHLHLYFYSVQNPSCLHLGYFIHTKDLPRVLINKYEDIHHKKESFRLIESANVGVP